MGRAVIVATTHTDLLEDLAPSVHIHKSWGKLLEAKYYPNQMNTVCSVTKGMKIEPGTREDYEKLAEFHYRAPKHSPIPMKVFCLKREDGELVGVIFYSWPPINCSGRKSVFGRMLTIKEVNETLATISRVVLHPKYRSIGLGEKLVKETLPLVGRPYVETMAVMAKYSPFFEKAGMRMVMTRQPPETVRKAVESLEGLGFKPFMLASAQSNYELLAKMKGEDVEKVKTTLCEVGFFKRLQACNRPFVTTPEFRKWIEKQGLEVVAKVISRVAVLAEPKVYLFWKNPCAIKMITIPLEKKTIT